MRDTTEKVYGEGTGKFLNDDVLPGLLAYRMQFYVLSNLLAENLVSGYLRMISDISDDHRSDIHIHENLSVSRRSSAL